MTVAAESGRRRRRWPRLVGGLLLFLVLAGVALRYALVVYAADLFAAVVQQVAATAGVSVEFLAKPAVGPGWFDAGAVTVRTDAGEQLVRAEQVTGTLRLFPHRPWVGVSLRLGGLAASLGDKAGHTNKDKPAPWALPEWPAVLSSVVLERAALALGGGRIVTVDADIAPTKENAVWIAFSRVDYSEDSGERAAEKLSGTLRLSRPANDSAAPPAPEDGKTALAQEKTEGLGDPQPGARSLRQVAQLHADLQVRSGAALWGAVLLDFVAHPLRIAANLSPRADGGDDISSLTATFGTLLSGSGHVQLSRDAALAGAEVVLSTEHLGEAFLALVREPFGGVFPALAQATMQGRGKLQIKTTGASRHASNAVVSLTISSLRTRAVEAEALRVELPWVGAARLGMGSSKGMLRAATIKLLDLPWKGIDLALLSTAGRVRAVSSQTWNAVGGAVHVTDLTFEDDAKKGPRLSAALRLENFDIARLGQVYGWPRLAGQLHGDLGRVTVDASAIRAAGVLDVDAFDGKLRFSKLRVEDPFGRVPSFGLDAQISEISLESVTKTLGVGRVTGVLEGHVTDLEVAAGQPVAFDADLHTVSRPGVSQMVDVRAIVQLGVLGGGDGGAITGTLLKVFDRYRYSALGLRCRLRNDTFEVRGVESEKGKDYIVKGSILPPSVSVVSHSQVISFSEMLRRVRRIAELGEGDSPDAKPK